MRIRQLGAATLLGLILGLFTNNVLAWNEGISFSLPVITKDPENLHGLNFSIWYNPESLTWRQFNLYIDLVGAHFWINKAHTPYHHINILAVSPVIRYLFNPSTLAKTFFEISVGLSYLSNTRFANANQGMHFAFQDRAGIGILLGAKEQLSLGIHAVHYSNASLSSHNSGITIPMMVVVRYKLI